MKAFSIPGIVLLLYSAVLAMSPAETPYLGAVSPGTVELDTTLLQNLLSGTDCLVGQGHTVEVGVHRERMGCHVPCPPNAHAEGETCPNVSDHYNGGCYANPPVFTPLACNDTIYGSAFSYFLLRDTDWYEITTAERDTVTWTVTAEFDVLTAILGPGTVGCLDRVTYVAPTFGQGCGPSSIRAVLDPGTYWLYVAPAHYDWMDCRNYVATVSCTPVSCFGYTEVDMGDLWNGYPTATNNPGHGLSGIAWLGASVSGDAFPRPDGDTADDGVIFLNASDGWRPCIPHQVRVIVTAGPHYAQYVAAGGHLYLSAWSDGHRSHSFCEENLCNGRASNWIIQDTLVTPGTHTYGFIQPGDGEYRHEQAAFRFRLCSHPVGRGGFGQSSTNCGTVDMDSVGEVEDYFFPDFLLPVELLSFEAVPEQSGIELRWQTASESEDDYFEILRDGVAVTRQDAANTPGGATYRWADESVQAGRSYTYSLAVIDMQGQRTELGSRRVTAGIGGAGVITEYALYQNYPNPFNPATHIAFDLPAKSAVTLKIYNMMGQEMATLAQGTLEQGRHVMEWDAASLPSGVYLYRLSAGSFVAARKMLLMK